MQMCTFYKELGYPIWQQDLMNNPQSLENNVIEVNEISLVLQERLKWIFIIGLKKEDSSK